MDSNTPTPEVLLTLDYASPGLSRRQQPTPGWVRAVFRAIFAVSLVGVACILSIILPLLFFIIVSYLTR